jgi:hypothetical protein
MDDRSPLQLHHKIEKKRWYHFMLHDPKFRFPVKRANDSVLQRGFKQVLIPHIKKETKCFNIPATP